MDRLLFPAVSLSEAARLYTRRFEERSRTLGLGFGQSRALIALPENQGVSQQRLSELTAIASPWLVRTLDRLEVMGFAERCPHLADRRARSLAVTVVTLVEALRRVIANLSVLDCPTATGSAKGDPRMRFTASPTINR